MPVPTTIASLSTTASANPPAGNTPALPEMDDHIRQAYAFIRSVSDSVGGKLDASAVSAFMLTVLNDVDAAAARTTLGAVGLTGAETIAGVKTFSSSPIAPTPTTGDNTTKVATTAFVKTTADASAAAVEAKLIGFGQTWQDVSASRAIGGGPYTNGTVRPILVCIATTAVSATNQVTAFVNGVPVAHNGLTSGATATLSFIVPPGSTYQLTAVNSTVLYWSELR